MTLGTQMFRHKIKFVFDITFSFHIKFCLDHKFCFDIKFPLRQFSKLNFLDLLGKVNERTWVATFLTFFTFHQRKKERKKERISGN